MSCYTHMLPDREADRLDGDWSIRRRQRCADAPSTVGLSSSTERNLLEPMGGLTTARSTCEVSDGQGAAQRTDVKPSRTRSTPSSPHSIVYAFSPVPPGRTSSRSAPRALRLIASEKMDGSSGI